MSLHRTIDDAITFTALAYLQSPIIATCIQQLRNITLEGLEFIENDLPYSVVIEKGVLFDMIRENWTEFTKNMIDQMLLYGMFDFVVYKKKIDGYLFLVPVVIDLYTRMPLDIMMERSGTACSYGDFSFGEQGVMRITVEHPDYRSNKLSSRGYKAAIVFNRFATVYDSYIIACRESCIPTMVKVFSEKKSDTKTHLHEQTTGFNLFSDPSRTGDGMFSERVERMMGRKDTAAIKNRTDIERRIKIKQREQSDLLNKINQAEDNNETRGAAALRREFLENDSVLRELKSQIAEHDQFTDTGVTTEMIRMKTEMDRLRVRTLMMEKYTDELEEKTKHKRHPIDSEKRIMYENDPDPTWKSDSTSVSFTLFVVYAA